MAVVPHSLPSVRFAENPEHLRQQLDDAQKTLQVHSEAEREKDGLLAQLGKRARELESEVRQRVVRVSALNSGVSPTLCALR